MKPLITSPRRCGLALLLLLAPAFAAAAEGDGIILAFTAGDRKWLWASLAIGVLSLFYGWLTSQWVLKQSPGNEAMRSVGQAIKDGARAYLSQQIRTMIFFVLVLGAGLYTLYLPSGPQVAALIALFFMRRLILRVTPE